jgi:hypothetical protein
LYASLGAGSSSLPVFLNLLSLSLNGFKALSDATLAQDSTIHFFQTIMASSLSTLGAYTRSILARVIEALHPFSPFIFFR